jgi:hypothetical protein
MENLGSDVGRNAHVVAARPDGRAFDDRGESGSGLSPGLAAGGYRTECTDDHPYDYATATVHRAIVSRRSAAKCADHGAPYLARQLRPEVVKEKRRPCVSP